MQAELSQWIAAGDLRRAGEWLVRAHAADVTALCGAMLRDRAAAEDVAQEVFSQAFDKLAGFRGEASPRTWLLAIARHRCIDYLRARRRDPWAGAGADGAEPDALPDVAPLPPELLLRRGDVETALAALGEAERALVVLRYKNGLEFAELAEAFGLREGTVRMRISRALARMRAALEAPLAMPAAPAPQAARARATAGALPPLRSAPVPPGAPPAMAPPPAVAPPPPPPAPAPAPRAPAPRPALGAAPARVDPLSAALADVDLGASTALSARLATLVARLPSA